MKEVLWDSPYGEYVMLSVMPTQTRFADPSGVVPDPYPALKKKVRIRPLEKKPTRRPVMRGNYLNIRFYKDFESVRSDRI